jgi:MFS family permease
MWELYAFWAFVPVVLGAHFAQANAPLNVPLWAFLVIGAGSIGCTVGGLISLRVGSARVAFVQLAISGICCVLSPFIFHAPTPLFLAFMLLWGVTVVGDSPQFSALNAQNAPRALVGSALTIGNCIGFSITIVSIQLLNQLATHVSAAFLYLPLAIGPLFGLMSLLPLLRPVESYRAS